MYIHLHMHVPVCMFGYIFMCVHVHMCACLCGGQRSTRVIPQEFFIFGFEEKSLRRSLSLH